MLFLYFYSTVHFLSVSFPMTDTKVIVNLEFREKFTHAVEKKKKSESFMITRAKISAVRASRVRRLFEGGAY